MIKTFLQNAYELIKNLFGDMTASSNIKDLLIEQSILQIKNNERYKDKKRLANYEFQVNSQNGEDGITEELFKRIKTTNKFY